MGLSACLLNILLHVIFVRSKWWMSGYICYWNNSLYLKYECPTIPSCLWTVAGNISNTLYLSKKWWHMVSTSFGVRGYRKTSPCETMNVYSWQLWRSVIVFILLPSTAFIIKTHFSNSISADFEQNFTFSCLSRYFIQPPDQNYPCQQVSMRLGRRLIMLDAIKLTSWWDSYLMA